MPKRTNDFQQLIHFIYSRIAPEGAQITESALLKERGSNTEREVDILIEFKAAGTDIRMAVECRDHERTDTITWIDGLIGKYRDLNVDRVIAVSRSGFSQGAVDKAITNNIELLTLREALDTDWNEKLLKIGVLKLTRQTSFLLTKTFVELDPPLTDLANLSDTITLESGGTLTLRELIEGFIKREQTKIDDYITENFLEHFKTKADLKNPLPLEHKINIPDAMLTSTTGTTHKILSLSVYSESVFEMEETPVKRHIFQSAGISSVILQNDKKESFEITLVEVPDKEAAVFVKEVTAEKRKNNP